MIPKLLCWLFGHRFIYDVFNGETATITDRLTGQPRTIPVVHQAQSHWCRRCNKPNPYFPDADADLQEALKQK